MAGLFDFSGWCRIVIRMKLKVLNIFGNIFEKLLPKIADGNVRLQLKAEIEKLEIEFRTQLRWIIGIVVMMIFANFFYQSITNSGFLLNIDTPIEALHVIVLLGAVKVVMGISIAELIKLYKDLFNNKRS